MPISPMEAERPESSSFIQVIVSINFNWIFTFFSIEAENVNKTLKKELNAYIALVIIFF